MPRIRSWSILGVFFLVAGCGGTAGEPVLDVFSDLGGTVPDIVLVSDPGHAEGTDVVDTRDGSMPDVALEIPGDPGLDPDGIDPCGDGGFLGCPCNSNNDCVSGFCIDTNEGLRCTDFCTTDAACPLGWLCGVIGTSGSDAIYGCIDPFSKLCQPCAADSQCVPLLGARSDRYACVPTGPNGSFCGVPCLGDNECPVDFQCVDVPDVEARQCRPANGEACPCNRKFRQHGYRTPCWIQNQHGLCTGDRTCDTECSAREPAAESCNGVDDDCDGRTDEDIASVVCELSNEYGTCPGMTACENGRNVCLGREPAAEVCNGIDDDCDGQTDGEDAQGCVQYFRDADGDGWGLAGDSRCLCAPVAPYTAGTTGDCDDEDNGAYPGATEVCNGKDDNCDGVTDGPGSQGCTTYYRDEDRDSWGVDGDSVCTCEGTHPYTAVRAGDCDDSDAEVSPGAGEVCNGRDDNCDGRTDEDGAYDCVIFYLDNDRDGYGVATESACKCAPEAPMDATVSGDCNDDQAAVHPGAQETCNGRDDNCDGRIDEPGAQGCLEYYYDGDGDGFGVDGNTRCQCAPGENYTATRGGDCNDADPAVYPGATELCNGKDDNCNGQIDGEGAQGCTWYYKDEDGDTYGLDGSQKCLCATSGFWRATRGGDCDDTRIDVNPGRAEVCNGLDDNCDGVTDPEGAGGCLAYYLDEDGDGYVVANSGRCLCSASGNHRVTSPKGIDCCDRDGNAHPGQTNWFDYTNNCGTWDWNCDGTAERFLKGLGYCGGYPLCMFQQGWDMYEPDCGQAWQYINKCSLGTTNCNTSKVWLPQVCR